MIVEERSVASSQFRIASAATARTAFDGARQWELVSAPAVLFADEPPGALPHDR